MTKKEEEACGACCCLVIVLVIIGFIIMYWYITLPIALAGGCIYLLAKSSSKKKSRKKQQAYNKYWSNKKQVLVAEQTKEYKHYKFGERLHPDEWYEEKCPHCNYPLTGKETKRLQCPKCHMSLMPIEYYTEKCAYCGEIMIKNQNTCKFCGYDKLPVEVIEKRSRHIPTHVKREVWRRDEGKCVECGSKERLEYDHIIPFSRGGSNTTRNIQLLCEDCNRKKSSNIE